MNFSSSNSCKYQNQVRYYTTFSIKKKSEIDKFYSKDLDLQISKGVKVYKELQVQLLFFLLAVKVQLLMWAFAKVVVTGIII